MTLYLCQFSLDWQDLLIFFIFDHRCILNFQLQLFNDFLFLLLSHLATSLMFLDLLSYVLILLIDCVNVGIKHINIIIERIILFFSFYESRHDFLSRSYTSRFFDLIESVFYNLHIPDVFIHQSFLFFVIMNPFLQSMFHQGSRVREFFLRLSWHFSWRSFFSSWLLMLASFIFLFQFLLQILNFALKILLVSLMLCFQC